MNRATLVVVVALVSSSLLGCERGCATRKVDEARARVSGAGFALGEQDCPDGLARCTEGTIEVSRLARVRTHCAGTRESCACPWERLATCAAGCAANGTELAMTSERAVTQLCAPNVGEVIARAPPVNGDANVGACGEGAYLCAAGVVSRCGAKAIAVCAKGCAHDGETLEDDVGEIAAPLLLCARTAK